jgi:hypothetical protein
MRTGRYVALEGCVPAISYQSTGFYCCCLGRLGISDPVLVLSIIGEILILIERNAPNAGNSAMKIQMDKTLRFWADVAAEHAKSDHPNLTKRQLVAQILLEYERRGDAMRCLNKRGRIAWKASPRFLGMLADAERDALDDLDDSA